MKQVLIVAEGKIARIFIEALLEKYFSNNYYIIVSNDKDIVELRYPTSFKIYTFDPLAEFRLSSLLTHNLHDIFVIMPDSRQRDEVCSIIRKFAKDIPITISCESKAEVKESLLHDPNLNTISTSFITARVLINQVPNIPLIARGFGLNKGEIMQINISFGSAYSYISIGSIQQKGWKIVGIYRKNTFLVAKVSMIIQPNDSILVVGEPRILNNIYKKINSNKGNFPAPFGIDIYVYIDFRYSNDREINNIINDALWLHKKIKNEKLVINILNPNNIEKLNEIKKIARKDIIINIDYSRKTASQKIEEDSSQKIGLIIIDSNMLISSKNRRILYKTNTPILKIGKATRLKDIKSTLVLCSSNALHIQNISYAIVDFASQLDLSVKLYEFEIDGEYNTNLATYYQNIGRIFNKKIIIEQTNTKNPIFWLHQNDDKLIQFIPLEIDLLKPRIFWLLNKNTDCLSLNIDKNPQILMPL
ncbi:hypothetical protein CCY99_07570 [Helicobacter sp. 16-1353]|uniref:TrkA C-terminal domain-containing protein n=1 Tax=Helicobacter sp. 16-1353 TaxID=2004996 RepID=UPI000DCB02DF|nr:TrkA C-terminal domain-containing protein [Helicobacter sp. 16-1353]RAX52241.1 hypothetical protein CCY99_07570 [Helicobacter sp. 16-1353]